MNGRGYKVEEGFGVGRIVSNEGYGVGYGGYGGVLNFVDVFELYGFVVILY